MKIDIIIKRFKSRGYSISRSLITGDIIVYSVLRGYSTAHSFPSYSSAYCSYFK